MPSRTPFVCATALAASALLLSGCAAPAPELDFPLLEIEGAAEGGKRIVGLCYDAQSSTAFFADESTPYWADPVIWRE